VTDYVGALAEGIGMTLWLTLASFLLGCLGGLLLMLARRSPFPPLRWLAVTYIEIVRGVPAIAWLFVIFYGLAQGGYLTLGAVTSAIVGFSAISSGYLAEIFRAAVGAVPRGQWEAAEAVGMSRVDVYTRVILPQALPIATPPGAAYLIGLLKDTSIAATIGVADITFEATQLTKETFDGFEIFLIAGLMYVGLGLPVAAVSRWFGTRLVKARYGV
jgi:polar amino acid transport system permease protein